MQAAVAESRARHAAPAVDLSAAPAGAGRDDLTSPPGVRPPVSGTASGLSMRALPLLDDVAEDMLVDRISDRLQERLRDQALRQFGFTGGLI